MTHEKRTHLMNAERALLVGRDMLRLGHLDRAGREAYSALFRAALGIIVHAGVRPPRTHGGVQFEFSKAAATLRLDPEYARLLSRTYDYKQDVDYGAGTTVPKPAEAEAALDRAESLIAILRDLLGTPA